MSNITASMVKDLRDKTGAGMMDCKVALGETNGDAEAAIDWLRKKGLMKAAKKAGRVAAEGLVGVAVGGDTGALVEVNSETDFVARNDQFKDFVKNAAEIALEIDGDLEKLLTKPMGSATVHNASSPELGKIGVLVGLKSEGDKAKLSAFGKQLAMHVAAAAPLALTPEHLSADVIERERNVQRELAKQSGKPDNVIDKMIEGRMRKFYEESVLMSQIFVIDGETPVNKAVEKLAKEIGQPVEVVGFVRFQVGEGIEKTDGDFTDEVNKLAGR